VFAAGLQSSSAQQRHWNLVVVSTKLELILLFLRVQGYVTARTATRLIPATCKLYLYCSCVRAYAWVHALHKTQNPSCAGIGRLYAHALLAKLLEAHNTVFSSILQQRVAAVTTVHVLLSYFTPFRLRLTWKTSKGQVLNCSKCFQVKEK